MLFLFNRTQPFIDQQIILLIMIKESEVVNFLDLIKHITEARNFKNSQSPFKSKKKYRYSQNQYASENEQNQRKLSKNMQLPSQPEEGKRTQSQFEHKMLKITHQIKRKPRSFKLDSFDLEKDHSNSDHELGARVNQLRTNLYQNYCQMIQRKRQERINKMFQSSQNQLNHNILNISDVVRFQSNNGSKSFKQTPFVKSKSLKPGFQCLKVRPNQKSKKKIQPQQLNIETVKSIKMPKIIHPNSSNKKINIQVAKYVSAHSVPDKKIVFNKVANIEGWVLQEDKSPFHIDYF